MQLYTLEPRREKHYGGVCLTICIPCVSSHVSVCALRGSTNQRSSFDDSTSMDRRLRNCDSTSCKCSSPETYPRRLPSRQAYASVMGAHRTVCRRTSNRQPNRRIDRLTPTDPTRVYPVCTGAGETANTGNGPRGPSASRSRRCCWSCPLARANRAVQVVLKLGPPEPSAAKRESRHATLEDAHLAVLGRRDTVHEISMDTSPRGDR